VGVGFSGFGSPSPSSPGIPSSFLRKSHSSVALGPVSFSPDFSPASISLNHSCPAYFVLSISSLTNLYYKDITIFIRHKIMIFHILFPSLPIGIIKKRCITRIIINNNFEF